MNRVWKEFSQIRGIRVVVLAAAAGVLLLLFGSVWSGDSMNVKTEASATEAYYSVRFYTENLEERIASLCREVNGINEAHVLLTLDGGSEFVYAETGENTARDYVILQGTEENGAVLVKEIYPKIRGVAVVCTRGDDSAVRLTVTELLAAALGIPTSSIRVAGT